MVKYPKPMRRTIPLALLLAAAPSAARAFPACDPSLKSQTVTFVHATDLHANYDAPRGGVSPYAAIRGFYEKVLAENPDTVFVDGGDDHEKGSLAETRSKGESTVEMTRAMGFDVRVLGNHDFAFGTKEALEHSRDPRAVVLASNIRYAGRDQAAFGAVRYAELQVGCVRVGFLGLVTRPWNERDEQYDGDYPGFRGRYDWAKVATEILRARKTKPDLTVLVSHLGRQDDLALAAKVRGIDLILGGHTHGITWTPIVVKDTRYVESGGYGKYVTRTDATVDLATRRAKWTFDAFVVPGSLPVDARLDRLADDEARRWGASRSYAAGCACRPADRAEAARAAAAAALAELGADAALMDLDMVWTPWPAGVLSAQDFADAFRVERQPPGTPGFNAFYLVRVRGRVLTRLLARVQRDRWAYDGPAEFVPGRLYRLALPKRAALDPDELVESPPRLGRPRFAAEAWRALDRYARARLDAGLCVDDGCRAADVPEDAP
jgi:hypothetical protein